MFSASIVVEAVVAVVVAEEDTAEAIEVGSEAEEGEGIALTVVVGGRFLTLQLWT